MEEWAIKMLSAVTSSPMSSSSGQAYGSRSRITRFKRCTLAKMPYRPLQTKMESILASQPLEMVRLDFGKLERACGKGDALVIIDVDSKFTVAGATKDQTENL